MSTSHRECFDVITAKDGRSTLRVCLTCATAAEHYARTTQKLIHTNSTAHDTTAQSSASEPPCATGLRVYEGAQVLAALLVHFGPALCTNSNTRETLVQPWHWVLELGCGCGLAGFTAAHLFQSAHVFFTDASSDCLALVRDSALHMPHCYVNDAQDTQDNSAEHEEAVHYTYPLQWCDAGVRELCTTVQRLASTSTNKNSNTSTRPALDLIIGSDIMYHRVDLDILLTSCRQLLDECCPLPASSFNNNVVGPYVVLCHFMRLVNGHVRLAEAARTRGFGIVAVPLSAFLHDDVVRTRGWGGLEAVILFRRTASTTSFTASPDYTSNALGDVAALRASLLRRAEDTNSSSDACRASVRELSDCLAVYPSANDVQAGRISAPVQEMEAMEMLHILTE